MQINKSAIKRFIRDSLGCTCPEEVFKSISLEKDPGYTARLKAEYLLIIGNKLLVYVIEPDDWRLVVSNLKQIFEWGKTKRDTTGLNRFRLVVSTPEFQSAQNTLVQSMETLPGLDGRLHLHVIPPQILPKFTF